jgi:hypothetical protein
MSDGGVAQQKTKGGIRLGSARDQELRRAIALLSLQRKLLQGGAGDPIRLLALSRKIAEVPDATMKLATARLDHSEGAGDAGAERPAGAWVGATPSGGSVPGSRSQPPMLGAAREAAAGEQAVGAALTDKEVGQVAEEIKTVMAELPPDELAAIAKDLDLSPEEVRAMVREPDFARLVAEEQARLG